MQEFCIQFSMDIAGGQESADDADTWTLEFGPYLRRLDYIYCIRNHYDRMILLRTMIWTWDPTIGTCLHPWKLFDRQSPGHAAGHHLKDGNR